MPQVDTTITASIGMIVMLLLRTLKTLGVWPQNKIVAHLLSFALSAVSAVAAQHGGASAAEIAATAAGAAVSATGVHEATQAIGDALMPEGKKRNRFLSLLFGAK